VRVFDRDTKPKDSAVHKIRARSEGQRRQNDNGTSRYELSRVVMLRDLTIEEFSANCHGRGLWKNRLQHQARRSAQRVLKNRAYDHLRAALLGNPASNMPLVTLVSLPSALFFQSTSLSPDRPLR
jgi:hypothetical protein